MIILGDNIKIVIAVISKLGDYLARSLVKDKNGVTLIDLNFNTSKDLIDNEDVNYICSMH